LGVDRFVAALHDKSRRHGIGFVLLCDHGMEPVDRVVDLRKILNDLDLPGDAYDVFIENTKATFWFHDASAAAAIRHALRSSRSGKLLEREDMRRYNLMFENRRYGDAFWYVAPGSTLFPNDFHQPLASLIRTVSDRQQRQRLRKPWHQADHGYLSENDCEIGFMVLAEEGFEAIDDGEVALIDIAPTLLDLLDLPKPGTMQGHTTLRPR
jgi:arylsulfatase A-like enzyme